MNDPEQQTPAENRPRTMVGDAVSRTARPGRKTLRHGVYLLLTIGLLAAAAIAPGKTLETATFVLDSMIQVAPLVVPGILLTAWIAASGAGSRIATAFEGRKGRAILMASLIGAVTPVCGVTVLPLMAGLLGAGVPLAPIMAFWLSSPITDPAMLATTVATLGWTFAVGKTVAAFGLGLMGGIVTASITAPGWTGSPLRRNRLVAGFSNPACAEAHGVMIRFWNDPERRRRFRGEAVAITRLILICLTPAFAAEHLLNAVLEPGALSGYVGEDAWWAVPLAVFVGAPAYLDGYAALPLTRSLMDHGMTPGAAMAFLVSGGVVSIWGAMAIVPVLRIKPFLLYLILAIVGSLLSGWIFDAIV